jgi:cell filamentation protein
VAPSERESLQWVAYFYPETYDPATRNGVLKNNFGERDQETLTEIEYAATVRRSQELRDNPQLVKHTYDSEHLKAIHQHLFQDVYPWAGEYRLVNMQKGPVPFADHSHEIDEYMSSVHGQVAETDWKNIDRQGFVSAVSAVFADLNQAHPFREGNGRASRELPPPRIGAVALQLGLQPRVRSGVEPGLDALLARSREHQNPPG